MNDTTIVLGKYFKIAKFQSIKYVGCRKIAKLKVFVIACVWALHKSNVLTVALPEIKGQIQ